jgi:hemerythrin superfamily protein
MDAISMLKDDHKTVEQLFKRFEKAGDRAHVEKREIVDRIIEELSVHAAVEEQCFYPVARAVVPGTEDVALESLEEHHVVKWVLSELETMAPDAERFDAKVTVLIENVRHHVKEEENDFFPKVRKELGRDSLNDLGDVMAAAKKGAPTHPHPRSPDSPPGNLIVGAAAGVADRITDTMNGLAQGSMSAVGDIIATVLGRKSSRVSPTGSRTARKTAAQVRETSAEATEAVIDAARTAKGVATRSSRTARSTTRSTKTAAKRTTGTAKRGAARSGRAAKAAVKGTVTSARKATSTSNGAKRAVTTAKRGATSTRRAATKAGKRTATTAKRSARKTVSTAKRSARRS